MSTPPRRVRRLRFKSRKERWELLKASIITCIRPGFKSRKERWELTGESQPHPHYLHVSNPGRNVGNELAIQRIVTLVDGFQIPEGTLGTHKIL